MSKHQPWEPGCVVLTLREINWQDCRQIRMAALAERFSSQAIAKAMEAKNG